VVELASKSCTLEESCMRGLNVQNNCHICLFLAMSKSGHKLCPNMDIRCPRHGTRANECARDFDYEKPGWLAHNNSLQTILPSLSNLKAITLTAKHTSWEYLPRRVQDALLLVVLPELGSAQLSHGFGALGSKLSWAATTLKLHQIASSEPWLSHGRGGSVPN